MARRLLSPVIVRTRSATVVLLSITMLAGGCAHERLPSPPPAADIARGNVAVEPIPTGHWVHVDGSTGIEPVEIPRGDLGPARGDIRPALPEGLEGARVRDPWSGAFIGGGLGAAAGGLAVLDLLALESLFRNDDSSLPPSRCRNICDAGDVAPFLITGFVIGSVVGYFVGGPRTSRVRN